MKLDPITEAAVAIRQAQMLPGLLRTIEAALANGDTRDALVELKWKLKDEGVV